MRHSIKIPAGLLCAAFVLPTLGCSPAIRKIRNNGNSVTYYTAEGGVVIKGGVRNAHSMCVMPPAQGVRQRTGKGEGKAVIKAPNATTVEVSGSGGSSHETMKLYDQTDASLFMQHGLYRICEMALNGGFDRWEDVEVRTKKKTRIETRRVLQSDRYEAAVMKVLDQTADLIQQQRAENRARSLAEVSKILEETGSLAKSMKDENPDIAAATATAIESASKVMDALVEENNYAVELEKARTKFELFEAGLDPSGGEPPDPPADPKNPSEPSKPKEG